MRVATDLRHWLGRVYSCFSETHTFDDTNGTAGSLILVLPDLRLESTPEVVASLDQGTAKRVFWLIHRKDDVNSEIEGISEHVGDQEAVDAFRGRAANAFLECLKIYKDIRGKLEWSADILAAHAENYMEEEVQRWNRIQLDDAARQKEWLDSIEGVQKTRAPETAQ